jgi:conjugal transfer pilus assembly protein TraI
VRGGADRAGFPPDCHAEPFQQEMRHFVGLGASTPNATSTFMTRAREPGHYLIMGLSMLTFFSRRAAEPPPANPQIPTHGIAPSVTARRARSHPPMAVAPGIAEASEHASEACAAVPRARRPACDPTLAYPPADPGLPAVAVADIIASQSALIGRLRRAVGGDDATFTALHLAPIESLASYIHLLPASAHAHFAGAGGLFRQCLEGAFFCAQAAGGRVFVANEPADRRQALEPRWRHAAFLAGLTCELGQPLARAVVCDDAGREWPRFLGGLDAWIDDLGLARYHVNWLPAARGAGHAEAAAVVGRILPADSLAWLSDGAPDITRSLFAVALDQREAGESPLGELVDAVRREVLRIEAVRNPSRYGLLRVGHHLEIHLLDAIRARVECGDWRPGDEPAAMLSWREGALHMRWPDAAATIVADLVARGLPGIPRASGTLVECLVMSGLLAADAEGRWLWPPPDAREGCHSVCFAHAGAVLPIFDASRALGARDAEPLPPAGKTVVPLASEELQAVRAWQSAVVHRNAQDVLLFPDGRVALSHVLANASHADLPSLLKTFDRRGWLARGDWPARGARVGLVPFAAGGQPGFVLTAQAARLLGLRS